jgi:F-type H+-transporting ATPase subunit b
MSSAELWVVVSTVIFAALVFRPIARALGGGLEGRRAKIAYDLDEAARLRAEAEQLLNAAKQRHDSAASEAAGILEFAHAEAQRVRLKAEEELRLHINRRERQATDRIAQAEAAAIGQIRARAVDIALAASASLLSEKLSGGEGDRLVDAAISSLPGRLSARG